MYLDQPMQFFLDKLASNSPEPGGGSVAALAGSLAAALVSMVANLRYSCTDCPASFHLVAEYLGLKESMSYAFRPFQ